MSWYEGWFDSDAYDLVYDHRDESEAARLVDLIEREVDPAVMYPHREEGRTGREKAKEERAAEQETLKSRQVSEAAGDAPEGPTGEAMSG